MWTLITKGEGVSTKVTVTAQEFVVTECDKKSQKMV